MKRESENNADVRIKKHMIITDISQRVKKEQFENLTHSHRENQNVGTSTLHMLDCTVDSEQN